MGLLDIFEIDTHTFATVLETCRGGDLESYLKEHQVQPLIFSFDLTWLYFRHAWYMCYLLSCNGRLVYSMYDATISARSQIRRLLTRVMHASQPQAFLQTAT